MDATQSLPYSEHAEVHADAKFARRRAEIPADASEDNLRPARGVLISVVIGAGLWAVIAAVGWLIFR